MVVPNGVVFGTEEIKEYVSVAVDEVVALALVEIDETHDLSGQRRRLLLMHLGKSAHRLRSSCGWACAEPPQVLWVRT